MIITTALIIKSWIYVSNTEANGKHYHDEKSDRSAVVYIGKTKVFSRRIKGFKGNFPAAYEDVLILK